MPINTTNIMFSSIPVFRALNTISTCITGINIQFLTRTYVTRASFFRDTLNIIYAQIKWVVHM